MTRAFGRRRLGVTAAGLLWTGAAALIGAQAGVPAGRALEVLQLRPNFFMIAGGSWELETCRAAPYKTSKAPFKPLTLSL